MIKHGMESKGNSMWFAWQGMQVGVTDFWAVFFIFWTIILHILGLFSSQIRPSTWPMHLLSIPSPKHAPKASKMHLLAYFVLRVWKHTKMTLNIKITKETRHKCTRTSQLSRINMLLSKTHKSFPPTRRSITARHVSTSEANHSATHVNIRSQSQHDTCQHQKSITTRHVSMSEWN